MLNKLISGGDLMTHQCVGIVDWGTGLCEMSSNDPRGFHWKNWSDDMAS